MAWLMTGSAKMRAKMKPSTPATSPDSAPRRMTRISMCGCPGRSVAGEAEEVPRVVHELVDHHVVAEQRGHALVHPDEVVDGQRQEHGDGQNQGDPAFRQGLGRYPGARPSTARY